MNYATSAVGSIRFEVLGSEEGAPLAISEELFGDEITRVVEWVEGAELSLPEEGPIRLRIHLRDADLYSLRFLE